MKEKLQNSNWYESGFSELAMMLGTPKLVPGSLQGDLESKWGWLSTSSITELRNTSLWPFFQNSTGLAVGLDVRGAGQWVMQPAWYGGTGPPQDLLVLCEHHSQGAQQECTFKQIYT